VRYRSYANFGFVALKAVRATSEFSATYGVTTSTKNSGGLETFMIFNERVDAPVVRIQAKEIPMKSLISAIESKKYLILPRLSSQTHFDDLCPPSSEVSVLRRLCIILLVRAKIEPSDDIHLSRFREFVERFLSRRGGNAVQYMYLYEDLQPNFVNAMISASDNDDDTTSISEDSNRRHVITLWRTDKRQARLKWLRGVWSGHPDFVNQSAEMLMSKINVVLGSGEQSASFQEVELNQLVDENSPIWYKRVVAKLWANWDALLQYFGKEELIPMLTVVGPLFTMLLLAYCLNYINLPKYHSSSSRRTSYSHNGQDESTYDMAIRELNARTYSEMILSTQPGVRTIIVLVSKETKDIILKRFLIHLSPWKETNTLLLGYVMLEKNYKWFRRLCSSVDLIPETMQSNDKTDWRVFIGTVISLNGYRRYVHVFFPTETSKPKKERRSTAAGSANREFLGFDSSSSSDEEDVAKTRLKAVKSLDELPAWLERLFEGCVRKVQLLEWPSREIMK